MALPSFGARLKLAFSILGDPMLAARVLELRDPKPVAALPPKAEAPLPSAPSYDDGALVLLSVLQREGRLVDFLQQDIQAASDEDVAAAARVVHDGCRAALGRHVSVVPLRDDDEGATVSIDPGYDSNALKLTGNVVGKGPWTGTVRHRGWRATKTSLPTPAKGHDASAIAPAEVDVS
ncbi:DUF2760 domain-containing protein [soil metagenome]